jgi:hypothetical protein
MLSYEDVGRAADWIVEAFGFEERERYAADDGIVFLGYASLTFAARSGTPRSARRRADGGRLPTWSTA